MKLIKLSLGFVKWVLTAAILVVVLAFVSLAVVDRVMPWPEAESTMDKTYGEGVRVCVGMSLSKYGMSSDFQRRYLILSQGRLATISSSFEPMEGTKVLEHHSSRFGFWLVVLVFLSCCGLSICRARSKSKGSLKR